jgi:hypothetical protein
MANQNTSPSAQTTLDRTRPDVVVGALLHMVTAYRSNRCPGLAACIARHFQFLAEHPLAHTIVRQVAAASAAEWAEAALENHALPEPRRSGFRFH